MSYQVADDTENPRITPAVQWLIAINVAIFFLQLTVVRPADVQQTLGFEVQDLGRSWWTIGTYMFVHGGWLHLALNMYTLYLFGPRVERAWSGPEFARYYLLCGLGGWFAHLLFARNAILFGATAAVLGVMLAYAMRWPDDEVYLFGVMPLRVKWTVAMLAAVSLVTGMAATEVAGTDRLTGVAYLAHLGGLAAGWLYLRTSSATSLDRLKQRVSQIPDVPDETPRPIPRLPRSREKVQEVDDIVAKSKAAVARRQASSPPTPSPKVAPKRPDDQLNVVLDKISEHGLDSLTLDERRILEEMSRKLKDRD
jgi:membrane associated rhomboid family serine protease